MPDNWADDWDLPIDDALARFGEPVVWTSAGQAPVAGTAVIRRESRMRREAGEMNEVQAAGRLLIKRSSFPLAAEFDRVTVPRCRGSGSTETWVVANENDVGNGAVWFDAELYDARRHVTAGLERAI